ncbi:MAG: NFACT RNA binding domain-containing protein [Nitrospiraceae bacterium]|nr:NFACT RNA binding domain-containing protein [Nitrospiraceae bacterium]
MSKAIALYSGGLDSILAILVMLKQGVEVTALHFINNFGCAITDKSGLPSKSFPAAEKFGFKVQLIHLGDKFIDIVKNPKFGHGKNMNPCIDCKILMIKEAKEMMLKLGADFIITGEVLWQRPMSQRRDTLDVIEKEAGVRGYLLRPLSAKLLKPTIAEESGLVNRDMLYGFNGRSRKPQMALAKELGLTEYPAPAGGCLLTDPVYSQRLEDLLKYNPDPEIKDINLLKTGRHFRISEKTKIIVGRDEKDNDLIESFLSDDDIRIWVDTHGSPLVVMRGHIDEEIIKLAASICAAYSGAKKLPSVEVTIQSREGKRVITTPPADKSLIEKYRV